MDDESKMVQAHNAVVDELAELIRSYGSMDVFSSITYILAVAALTEANGDPVAAHKVVMKEFSVERLRGLRRGERSN